MPNPFGLLRIFGLRQQNVHPAEGLRRREQARCKTGFGSGLKVGAARKGEALEAGFLYTFFIPGKKVQSFSPGLFFLDFQNFMG